MRHVTVDLLLLLLYPLGAFADFTGPVVSVLDGDTIEVLHNAHPERVRLSGIDCPEKGQAYGEAVNYTRTEWHQISCLSSSMARSPYEQDILYHGINV